MPTCWYRFDEEYVSELCTVAAVTTSSASDNNWYTDSGATDRITGELDKLTMHDAYNGTDPCGKWVRYGDISCWHFYYSHSFS
jgi:hypothetical protein